MFQVNFKDLFGFTAGQIASGYTLSQIVVNVLFSLLCALVIYWVYRSTFSGVLYSKNFAITIILVSVLTSLIVMTISGNLALSLGMVGALSIIRFRTPVKDPRDLAFLFWSVANGIMCGVAAYKMAIISVGFLSICVFFLNKRILWAVPYLLVVKGPSPDAQQLQQLIQENSVKMREKSTTTTQNDAEIVYEVRLRNMTVSEFIAKIKVASGVQQVVMVSYEGDLDEA